MKRVAIVLAFAGALLCGKGVYIYAKARYAQFLLERSWEHTLGGERGVKPWRWADTSPVAKLDFPRQHRSYIVLAGASGRTMAFGPGHIDGTAAPEETGNCAISAHRDTQFAVLRDVAIGDEVILQTRDGRAIRYRVRQRRVTNDRDVSLLAPSRDRVLTLITCYPFDAIRPGGPLRYVVVAAAI